MRDTPSHCASCDYFAIVFLLLGPIGVILRDIIYMGKTFALGHMVLLASNQDLVFIFVQQLFSVLSYVFCCSIIIVSWL